MTTNVTSGIRVGESGIKRIIRGLIWTYFFLLMFEGVLRKWVLPGLSDPLMLIRDPFLLAIYALAIADGIFSVNGYVLALAGLGALTVFLGFTIGTQDPIVTGYGFDACFFHLPLIFIIPKVMTLKHVIALGRWVVILTIPMAIVMVIQFRSPREALINCGAGGGTGAQIGAALGRIRPPGFFTFINGAAQFLALSAAFLIYGLLKRTIYSTWLILICGTALVIAVAVSSSRLALGAIGVVTLMVGLIILYDRNSMTGLVRMLLPIGLILLIATNLDVFKEGREVFEARLVETGDAQAGLSGTASNWTQRVLGDYYGWYFWLWEAPILGKGLGMGTKVGERLLAGSADFLSAEGEPARIVIEMGPLIGSCYMVIRLMMCVTLYRAAAKGARLGNPLPMLIFGACVMLISTGQFSQTSTVGFSVLGGGLCLAACNKMRDPESDSALEQVTGAPGGQKPRGRSRYAEMLRESDEKSQLIKDDVTK
jgi:hypothetical protein